MTDQKEHLTTEERVTLGQRSARGDTGDGSTGVPEFEQAMPNRPGDANGADELHEHMTNAGAKKGAGEDGAAGPGVGADELKERQARGNRGPDDQEGFGQGA